MKKADHEELNHTLSIALDVSREAVEKARAGVEAAKGTLRRCLDAEALVREAIERSGTLKERATLASLKKALRSNRATAIGHE